MVFSTEMIQVLLVSKKVAKNSFYHLNILQVSKHPLQASLCNLQARVTSEEFGTDIPIEVICSWEFSCIGKCNFFRDIATNHKQLFLMLELRSINWYQKPFKTVCVSAFFSIQKVFCFFVSLGFQSLYWSVITKCVFGFKTEKPRKDLSIL